MPNQSIDVSIVSMPTANLLQSVVCTIFIKVSSMPVTNKLNDSATVPNSKLVNNVDRLVPICSPKAIQSKPSTTK